MKTIKLKRGHLLLKKGAVVTVDDLRARRMIADGIGDEVKPSAAKAKPKPKPRS